MSADVVPPVSVGENGVTKLASEEGLAALRMERVSKHFGELAVVKSVSLELKQGRILSLLGPSGCGKTTILRMIAGFLRPTSGMILVHGEDVTGVPTHRRNLGMVFQNYSLFPHMTVAENVAFGLKMRNVPADASRRAIGEVLAMVRMTGMETRYPAELSGGQQQRVALARAVVTRPRLLLLDEPFGALDRKLREEMQIEVKQLQRELGISFVFVTHDQEEALTLSDCIAVIRDGEVQQAGTPIEIFEAPTNFFVAEFFGALNVLPVHVVAKDGSATVVEWGGRRIVVPSGFAKGPAALLAVRASDARISQTRPDHLPSIDGIILNTIYKGTIVLCRIRLADGTIFEGIAEPGTLAGLEPGRVAYVGWSPAKALLFPDPGVA